MLDKSVMYIILRYILRAISAAVHNISRLELGIISFFYAKAKFMVYSTRKVRSRNPFFLRLTSYFGR